MSSDPIKADYGTLGELQRQVLDLGIALDNTRQPLGRGYDQVLSGAGQFADHLSTGATAFLLAWQTALDTMSDGSSVVGNSIGKSVVDLAAVDATYSSDIVL
ncbi:MAG: hypothetical protein ACRC35_04250 [Angustibacter sp.]